MTFRKLNREGLAQFEQYIESVRNGSNQHIPNWLLDDPLTSEEPAHKFVLEIAEFTNRYHLGVYMVEKFRHINMQEYYGDSGFWSALALFWFDQLCPVQTDGSRKAGMIYNYILSKDYKHRPRHAIFTTWQLVDLFGDDARFLLCREMSVRGELIEQMMSRQYYLGCEGVMRAASKLYYDTERQTYKKGSAARSSAGCVYRFVIWLQQLELTYDLFSLKEEDIFEILPKEFDRFR